MLNPSNLKNALLSLNDNPPASRVEAAQAFCSAYDDYAQGGQAIGLGGPVSMFVPPAATRSPNYYKMVPLLIPAFVVPTGTPNSFLSALTAGVTAYWGGALFQDKAPVAGRIGIAAPPVAIGALQPSLLPLLSNPQNPANLAATLLAQALDACTRSVLVTFVQVPPVPPIISPVM